MVLKQDAYSNRRRIRGSRTSLLSGVAAILCLIATQVNSFTASSALTGVGYRNQTDYSGDVRSSMYGGAEIYIKGEGMEDQATSNFPFYTITSFNNVQSGQTLDDNDAFNSAPKAGRLATHTPSLMTMLSAEWKDFQGRTGSVLPTGHDSIYVTTEVQTVANTSPALGCSSSTSCRLRYKRDWTAQLHDVVPNVVYAGQRVDFWFDIRGVHATEITPEDYFPIEEMRIGATNCDWNGLMDYRTRLQSNNLGKLSGYVGTPKPTKDAVVDARFMSGYAYKRTTSYHCNYANDECWYVQVLPKVETISASSGYSTGGQMLTITGQGLNGTAVSVTTDDEDCVIQTKSATTLTCQTGAKSSFTTGSSDRPGLHGMTKTVYATKSDFDDFSALVVETSLATTFEVTERYDELEDDTANTSTLADEDFGETVAVPTKQYLQVLDGWFKAPADGNYRFYMSCDDSCQLQFDATNYYGSGNAISLSTVISTHSQAMKFRTFMQNAGNRMSTTPHRSSQFALTAGRYYQIRGQHKNNDGGSHFTVAVEIENGAAAVPGHPNTQREVQSFEIDQDQTAEIWKLVVDNPDSLKWYLIFTNNQGEQVIPDLSEFTMTFDEPAWSVERKIGTSFFANNGGHISVIKTMTDVDGLTTTVFAEATQITYEFKLWQRINGFSFASVTGVSESGVPTFNFFLPALGDPGTSASSAPLEGTFTIKCQDPDSSIDYETRNIHVLTEGWVVAEFMNIDIPFLASSTRGWTYQHTWTWERGYWQNYRKFHIFFEDYQGNVPQCTIQSSTDVGQEVTGFNPTFSQETIIEGGSNLFFEPIPNEMLYTVVNEPQVKVTVDDQEGACANVDCNYQYEDSALTVTSQSYDKADSLKITVSGTDLSTLTDTSIIFGGAPCGTITAEADTTTLTCNLAHEPYGGDHDVELYDSNGLVPGSGLSTINVPVTVSSMSPDTGLNKNGGDELTITGTGFPNSASLVEVKFSDDTLCLVSSSTPTEIVCKIEGFEETYASDLNSDSKMEFTISLLAAPTVSRRRRLQSVLFPPIGGFSFGINPISPAVASVSPTTVNPVLKATLTLTLTDYDITMVASDFTVNMVSLSDKSARALNVIEVDDAAKELKVLFPGAKSGTYAFKIRGQNGSINCPPTTITIESVLMLTDFSPKTGSTFGGTKLTLTGYHFGTVKTDNPVKVGDNYCLVETTGDTEITCRIEVKTSQAAGEGQVIVFARTTEENQYNIGGETDGAVSGLFDYQAPSAAVSAISSAYDAASNSIQVTITGTGLSSDCSSELIIDEVAQTCVSEDSTTAVFQIVNIKDISNSDIKFYTVAGTPDGASTVASHTFTPALVSVSPNTATSSGGAKLQVTGVGFGIDTVDLNLYHQETTQNICSSVEVTAYGTFTCYTIVQEIQSSDTIKLVVGGSKYDCANSDTALCALEALDASSPTISAIVLTDASTLTISGTNFDTGTESTDCNMLGVTGTGVVDSANQVTCTFAKGVPVSTSDQTPTLKFNSNTNANQNTALSGAQTISNPVGSTTGQTGLTCSFQGGCLYEVTASGLTSTLDGDVENKITFCDQECILDLDSSSASSASCKLPALMTTFSASTYDMADASNLAVSWTGSGSASQLLKLSDGNNLDDYSDSSSPCQYQVSATTGYVYQIDEVKVFINNLIDKTPFDALLKLQGSDAAQSSWTDLYTFDGDIHEGWNSVFPAEGSTFSYNTIRFLGEENGSCRLGEIKLIGLEVFSDTNTSTSCTGKITIGGVESDLTAVEYNESVTPYLDVITPRYGAEQGGKTVVFTGSGFTSTPTVLIDDRECLVVTFDSTTITCTTADKPFSSIKPEHPSLVISIDGVGHVATKGFLYRYVANWSNTDTWGGDFIPEEGDAVEIPVGRTLLVDVDSTPILSFITVLGSLIFAPETDKSHQRTFDATYIIVNGGYLEIGTEEFPYDSKLTITMHGDEYTPALPIYGNKCIAVRNGRLEMHGPERSHVWTDLFETADAGATSITLNTVGDTELDWQVGEEIVIASTDFNGRHAEQRTISSVSQRDTNPIIGFTTKLTWKHYAGVETYGDDTLEMRAEVGLLSRNVKYRGDEETSALNQYGAHIMMASPGDESVVGRIENWEFTDVGQAFKLGRYPIHFHMIGTVTKSYIKNNAIHQTYNRAITIHGVHYLKIINNVAYKNMGHAIFIEDAAETKNLIDGNLVVDTRASDSLLNTDQTPASFWITHPDNILRNNHAAGSDRYGYWYDLQVNSIGPSFDPNICPENSKLGEFRDNVAHSNGRYGLRIFHQLIPREKPCSSFVINRSSESFPFGNNAPIIAEFHNLLSYKNNRNGAIAERIGAVQFHNFKVADNILAGIEFSEAQFVPFDDYTFVKGGLVVGRSANREDLINNASPHGIIGPRSEWLSIHDTKFYNFDFNSAAALGDCSHCWHPASTDMGARTIRTENLGFDSTVTKRIRYQYPFRGIYEDLDGTLTGLGAKTWATDYYKHNEWEECSVNNDVYDGLICNSDVEVRQILFNNYDPNHFDNMDEFIAQLPQKLENQLKEDSTVEDAEAEPPTVENDLLKEYVENDDNYSNLFMVKNNWAAPFVTGKRYNIRWGTALDFESMDMTLSRKWTATDKQVLLMSKHIDPRELIEFYDMDTNNLIANMTYADNISSGSNYVYNWTDTREFGWRASMQGDEIRRVNIKGIRCINPDCDLEEIEDVPITDFGFWSQAGSWPDGVVPTEGNVNIIPGLHIIYDLADSPLFDVITVNGKLSFLDDKENFPNMNLNCKYIFVRAGQLAIGSEEEPFQANAKITLFGEKNDEQIKMSGTVEAGNKLIANSGLVELYGKPRSRMVRLLSPVYNGYTETLVEQFLDWVAGDMLYFAPTNHNSYHHEYIEIEEYNEKTGLLKLKEPFEFYHYGGGDQSDDWGGIDVRCEVILLTRNVQIVGDGSNDWGCALMTTDRIEFDQSIRVGRMILKNIEVYQGGQEDTYKAAIRYEGASRSEISVVDGVSVWGGNAKNLNIKTSKNITVKNSSFLGGSQVGIILETVENVHLDNIFLGDIKRRILNKFLQTVDKEGGIAFCSFNQGVGSCRDNSVKNCIVAGVIYAGYIVPGNKCGETGINIFENNVAHSIDGSGAHIYPDPSDKSSEECYEGGFFKAYKCNDTPLTSFYASKEVRMHDMVFLDNHKGVSVMIGQEGEKLQMTMTDIQIYGEDDNLDCPDGQSPKAMDKFGMMLMTAAQGGKPLHPTMPSSLPIHKVKTDGSWGGQANANGLEFHKFKATTKCGRKQHAIEVNPTVADYFPVHKFKGTKFYDIEDEAMIFLRDPDEGWANPTDCGKLMTCTGPNNIVLQFESTQFLGITTPVFKDQSFTIAQDVKSATEAYDNCVTVEYWNAAYCRNNRIGVLLFESLDADTRDRTVIPIILTNEETGYSNTVNSFMDHVWDGFYTGQLRLSRFPVQIETGQDYLVYMTGTPPNKMRYTLRANSGGTKLRLYYPNAGSYQVYANNRLVKETDWDPSIGSAGALTKTKGCGENRFVGVVNFLEFYLTTGCEIRVEPLDQIKSSVRLSWTLDEFYAEGGTTTFTDRVAAALGIPAYRIKTVSVYEGSVIVDFFILPDEEAEDPVAELASVGETFIQVIQTKQGDWLGAPILDVVSGEKIVVESKSQPIINPDGGNSGTSTLIDDFLADRDEKTTKEEEDDETITEPTEPIKNDEDSSNSTDGESQVDDTSASTDDATDESDNDSQPSKPEDNTATDDQDVTEDKEDQDDTDVPDEKEEPTENEDEEESDEKGGSISTVIQNRYVTEQIEVQNTDSEDDFIVVILIVIVAVIVLVGSIFICRICLAGRAKKVIISPPDVQSQTASDMKNQTARLDRAESLPGMDNQFVADDMDVLEMTKKKRKGIYNPLSDNSSVNHSRRGDSVNSKRGETAGSPTAQK